MSVDVLLSNRVRVFAKRGPVLESEVHPRIPAGNVGQILAEWKSRNVAMGRKASLLFTPFCLYFHAHSFPVAFSADGEEVLRLGFGDASDPGEPPQSLVVGGTRYLMAMVGWQDVSARHLLQQATSWFEQVGGRPEVYLPPCPGGMGIAREWVKVLLRDKVTVEVVPGLGAKELYGEAILSVGAPGTNAAQPAGRNEPVDDSDVEPDGG